MSMALMIGFIAAYPMNWWLVARRLKHGMLTVRRAAATAHEGMAGIQRQSQGTHQMGAMTEHSGHAAPAVAAITIGSVIVLSFLIMAAGIAIGVAFS
jgi:hypothetical protein